MFVVIVIKQVKSIENEKLLVIGQIASNIAHDIRNPLGTIRSSVTRIEKQNETKKKQLIKKQKESNAQLQE